jgi:tetratricopeptide (TPR) repeat protein
MEKEKEFMAVGNNVIRIQITVVVFVLSAFSAQRVWAQTGADQAFPVVLRSAEDKMAAKQWKEAAELWERVVQANPVQVRFWKQLADALYRSKDYKKAIPVYEKVIELRGGGYPAASAYNIACCYALLGDKESAMTWLQKSFTMGYPFVEETIADADLISLHGDPRFQNLVGQIDTSKMSREQGWRTDIDLLVREVKRKGYVFQRTSSDDFAASVNELIKSIPRLTDLQMSIELMRLVAKLGDGHTTVTLGPNSPQEFLVTLPIKFYLFKEGLFVIATDPKYKELLGAQVLRFENNDVPTVINALTPLINRDDSNMWIAERAPFLMRHLPLLHGLGLISSGKKVELTLRDFQGNTRTVQIEADMSQPNIGNVLPSPKGWINLFETSSAPPPLYLKNESAAYWYEYIPDRRLVYFQYNLIRDTREETLAKFCDRLFKFIADHDVDKLVIDMRWNNGGNIFLNQSLLRVLMADGKVNRRGKLFIIIGRRVFSAAQTALGYFEKNTNAILIGEPSGSSPNFIGEEDFITLPYSKLLANVSDLSWQGTWPTDHRTWIAPQIYIEPTFEAYRTSRDPVMEAIFSYQ